MKWIHEYQLVLFDFDGLLVNTEMVHFMAYKKMCADRGVDLNWDFPRYTRAAHYRAEALQEQVYEQFPELKAQEPQWAVLYAEKKRALMDLFRKGAVELMPGVDKLLTTLNNEGILRCVVTHSPDDLVQIVRDQHPILNTIPHWVTRHDYHKPKPDSECYHKAIQMYAKPRDRVIGFEDTPRGMQALMGTRAKPVLVSTIDYPEIAEYDRKGIAHFHSLEDVFKDQTLS